jgi:peptidoglycan glycosyltransferase
MAINTKSIVRRMYVFLGIFALLTITLVLGLGNATKKLDISQQVILDAKFEQSLITRGSFYDRNMSALAYDNNRGIRMYSNAYPFGSVLGYDSNIYGCGGLEYTFNDLLVSQPVPGSGKGTSIVLTLDSGIQGHLVDVLDKNYPDGAAAIVMNARTGEILGMASTPTYDPASIDSDFSSIEEADNGAFSNKAVLGYPPGSVMKLATAAAIARGGLEDEVFHDDGALLINGYNIVNFDGSVFGDVTLVEGLGYSVNTYMAYRAVQLGGEAMDRSYKRFLIGSQVDLDFTSINSQYSLRNPPDQEYDDLEIGVTAIGQGKTTITPLQISMITASICNGGSMPKPYLILRIVDSEGSVISEAAPTALGTPLTPRECAVIQQGMGLASTNVGFDRDLDVFCKTGTAETGTPGINHIWMTCYFSLDGSDYVVTAMAPNQAENGRSLTGVTTGVYRYLEASTSL